MSLFLPLRAWYICPRCFNISIQSITENNHLCIFCKEYAEKKIPTGWRKDAFLQSIVLQKMRKEKCNLCKEERIAWHGLSICHQCHNNYFYPGIWDQNYSKGWLQLVTDDLKKIPPAVFKLQKTGDLLVFEDVNPLTQEKIYWVWFVP